MQFSTPLGLNRLGEMTSDRVALAAATNPGSVYAQVAELEIRRRVAKAQIDAANAQKRTAGAQRITALATVGLIAATLIVAVVTYLKIGVSVR